MKTHEILQAGGIFLASLAFPASLPAADAHWDIDGSTAGAGGAAPAGTWSTTAANWSADSTGASATSVWTDGDSAIFSAGSNATGQFNVTNAGVTADNITQQEGRVRITGGILTMADTGMVIDTQTRVSADYDLRIDSVIANSGAGASSITKNGTGILMLTSTNTYSGGFTLNAGTVTIEGNGGVFGSGTLTLAGGNFTKSWGSGSTAVTVGNALNVTGAVNVAIVQGQPGNLVLGGNWGAGSSSGVFGVGNTAVNGLAIQSSTIQITGNASAYTGTFSHNNLASGGNRLRFGTANAGNVGYDASNAKFLTSGSTSGTNALDLADGTYGTFKMGELAGTGGAIRAGWASAGNTTLETGALNTSSRFAGAILDNPNGSGGRTSLNKVGTGALELSLAAGNSYSAGTTITAGTLLAANTTGSATGTGAITMNGGALGGSGIIAPTGTNGINATAGAISPGGSISATTGGSFSHSIGNLTINLGSTTGTMMIGAAAGFEFSLGAAGASLVSTGTSDLVTLLGISSADVTFNGNLIDFGGTGTEGYYKLFDTSLDETTWSGLTFDGTTGLVSGGLFASNLASGLTGDLIVGTAGNGGNSGDIYLHVQAVPEPGSALVAGLGILMLLRRRR